MTRTGLLLPVLLLLARPVPGDAQGYRGWARTYVSYVEIQELVLDSLPEEQVPGLEARRELTDGTRAVCTDGFCRYYRSGSTLGVAPLIQDVQLNFWGGTPGLRGYVHLRARQPLGPNPLWPRSDQRLEALAAYVEYRRSGTRVRAGRLWQTSPLGFYNFDGSTLTFYAGTIVVSTEWIDGSTHTSSSEDAIIGLDVTVSGLTLVSSDASGHHFTDGTLTISNGTDVFLSCTLTNVVIEPVGTPPGTINPGLLSMNMQNLQFGTGLGSTFADEFGSLIAPASVPDQGALEMTLADFYGGDIQAGVGSFGNVNGKIDGAPAATTVPFACFGVNKAKIELRGGGRDKIKIEKGVLALPLDKAFDPAADKVTLVVDGLTFVIPVGSFEKKGEKNDYVYKTGSGVKPRIHARLNFHKAEWETKIDDVDATAVDNSDGVSVSLEIGTVKSSVDLAMTEKVETKKTELKYKAESKLSCRGVHPPEVPDDDPDDLKRSCLSFVEVTYHAGQPDQEILQKFSNEIGHPETTFVASNGAAATFHTSCSQCLVCGQTDASGEFTITGISDATGKLADKCGVTDASCGTTPPAP